MFDNKPNEKQHNDICAIIKKYKMKALKDNKAFKETAFQDADRKGMDAIREYCRTNAIDTFGIHIVAYSNELNDFSYWGY